MLSVLMDGRDAVPPADFDRAINARYLDCLLIRLKKFLAEMEAGQASPSEPVIKVRNHDLVCVNNCTTNVVE